EGPLSVRCGREPPGIQRKPVRQDSNGAANFGYHLFTLDVVQYSRDEPGHFADLGLAESSRGDSGAAEAHSAWIEGRILIEGDGVAIGGNVRGLERGLRFFAANASREHINQQQMRVGA